MGADGLSKADIEAVQDHLAMLRINELVPTTHHILRQLIDGVEAAPTAMNVSVAQGTYFRGMKLALAEIDRRFGGQRVEDDDVVDRILLTRSDPRLRFRRSWWIARIAVAIHQRPSLSQCRKPFRWPSSRSLRKTSSS